MVKVRTTITVDDREHGRWLYAFLMRGIEQELTEDPKELDRRYASESPIDHAARMERYEKAFKEFDRVLQHIADAMTKTAQAEKNERRKKFQMEERKQHDDEATGAGKQLDSFDNPS